MLDEFYDAAFLETSAPMRRFYDTLYHAIQFASEMPTALNLSSFLAERPTVWPFPVSTPGG